MLEALDDGAMILSEVLAAGFWSEQATKANEKTRPGITRGSFIVLAYVWLAHRWVSHTPWHTRQ